MQYPVGSRTLFRARAPSERKFLAGEMYTKDAKQTWSDEGNWRPVPLRVGSHRGRVHGTREEEHGIHHQFFLRGSSLEHEVHEHTTTPSAQAYGRPKTAHM